VILEVGKSAISKVKLLEADWQDAVRVVVLQCLKLLH